MHSRHDNSGVEIEHLDRGLEALNLSVKYTNESEEQIVNWAVKGFNKFLELQQRLFREIYRECLEMSQKLE